MTVTDSRGPDAGWSRNDDSSTQGPGEVADAAGVCLDAPTGPSADTDSTVSSMDSGVPDLGADRGPVWLDGWVGRNAQRVVSWRRQLHTNPELSRGEYQTTAMLVDILTRAGLRPQRLSVGTGVVCDVGPESGPIVALRGDIDALPLNESTGLSYSSTVDGVAHACGHDAHAAISLGAGLALAEAPELPGRVRLIFQPAEEVMPGGALDVLADGWLDGVERIFGLHCEPRLPVGSIGTRVGAITSAADLLELRLTSPGGHTSRPHLTADLVHALGTVIKELPGILDRRVDPRTGTVLTWGAVHSGEAPNAIPQQGVLRGTLRTGDRDTWTKLEPLVSEAVHGLLGPLDVGIELRHRRGVPPVVNDATSTALFRSGIVAAMGERALAGTPQSSGGEDFGWYLENVPGAFGRLGVRSDSVQPDDLHQPGFVLDERTLFVGVRTLVHTAIQALAQATGGGS